MAQPDLPTDPEEESTRCSSWATTMARALETRLLRDYRERDRRIEEQDLEQHLLKQNRIALQQLENPEGDGIEAVRMRYHVLPISSTQAVRVFLEVDVSPAKAANENSIFFGLHLSCTSANGRNPALTVRTHSGIVPELQYGKCVTVTAIVEAYNGIVLEEETDNWALCLSVEAHWNCTLAEKSRRARKLAFLRLSLESLLLVQQDMTFVDFTPFSLKTSAVYECRKPYSLHVDVSRCCRDWNEWVVPLNNALRGTGHRIDVSNQGKGATVSILVFAFPEEDLPGTLTSASLTCSLL